MQRYLKINTWPQHVPINNLLPLKKDRKKSKLGTWILHTLSEKNKEDNMFIDKTSLKTEKRLISQDKKNGSLTTIFNTKGSRLTRMNLHSLPLRWNFIEEEMWR